MSKEFRGGERQTLALVRELASRIEQRVVVRRAAPLEHALANANGLRVEIRPVPNSIIAATRATSGVDLVHVHDGRSVLAAAGRALLGTPFIATRRVFKQPKARAATRWCYAQARSIVAVSDAVADVMRGYDVRCRVQTIRDCVPHLPEPDPARVHALRERFSEKILIGHVGQLDDKAKGQRLTIAAARRLQDRRPEIAFLLIGRGVDEPALRSEAGTLANVHFEGWSANIAEYYAALDVLVFPSRTEALGSSLLEAMSFGVPVVASSTGGIPEVVEPQVNGLLHPVDDLDRLVEHIVRLADNAELRRELGRHARETASRLSAGRMARTYLELYEQTLRCLSPRAPHP